jgi:hypothetical protein
VLKEASQAGYKGIELGPYGYIPMDIDYGHRILPPLPSFLPPFDKEFSKPFLSLPKGFKTG